MKWVIATTHQLHGVQGIANLEQLRFLQFHFASLKPIEFFKQCEKLLMGDHHFHLLFGSPVSMANNANHTSQLTSIHVQMYAYMYSRCMCVCACVCACVCMCMYVCVCVCMLCMYVCVCVCVLRCMCVCVYVHVHVTCTYTRNSNVLHKSINECVSPITIITRNTQTHIFYI